MVSYQKDLEKEISRLKSHGDVEKKFCELNVELKQAKDYVRKLQVKERDDARIMQTHHEQLILLEDKARKLTLQIREKKKIQGLKKGDEQIFSRKVQNYTMEDLEKL